MTRHAVLTRWSASCLSAFALASGALATERWPLPGGAALVLEARELRLEAADGRVQARHAVRGESLDARLLDGGRGVALLLDSDAERAQPLRFDLGRGTLQALAPLPDAGRGIATTCLYRDAQGLLHAFVLAENGFARQWLLPDDAAPLTVREFAVAPDAEHCRADDGRDRLYVSEAHGLWRHAAEPEGDDARAPVALVRPHGPLRKGGGAIALRADGTVSVRDGRTWRRFDAGPVPPALPIVLPRAQTTPVARAGDAADDPAIWIHPRDPAASLVLATDKKRGLAIYDLQGRELQFLPVGRLNNVDLRQALVFGDERLDIAVATHRDERGLVLFAIDGDRRVSELARLPVGYPEIYGLCMRRTAAGEGEVFVNDKDGRLLQLRLERDAAGGWSSRRLREIRFASQLEGCVSDDATGRLFVGEEKHGLWSLAADPADLQGHDRRLLLPVGGVLRADVEGLAIHRIGERGHLVVSSQGNDSYVVLDAAPPHRVLGAFRIGIHLAAGIDGASETDGLDITALPLGPHYPNGMLVVQDGRKRLPEGPQNFKYLSWDEVLRVLGLP
jgi:3-phytase